MKSSLWDLAEPGVKAMESDALEAYRVIFGGTAPLLREWRAIRETAPEVCAKGSHL